MTTAPLVVKVVIDGDDPERLKLVFDDVVSSRNFTVFNAPTRQEFEAIENYCQPVVWAIFSRWVNPRAGIAGIQNIELRRHTITVVKADQHAFKWEVILEQLYLAIRDANLDREVTLQVNEGEAVNQVVDYVIDSQHLKSWLGLPLDSDSLETWTMQA